MTHLTYSGLFCFFFTERIDERNIKAPTATSKCRPATSEVAWVFLGDNAALPPAYRVKVACLVDIRKFCDRKGYIEKRER